MAKKNTVEIILSAKDRASKVTKKAFDNVQQTAGTAFKAMGVAALAAASAVGTVSAVVGNVGVNYNAMKEQSQIAWETILKDADQAKRTLLDIQELGAKTPFEFQGLDRAGKLLEMAKLGGDQLKESLTSVGDAVSAIGGNQDTLEGVSMALFQMQAKGKVQAEEMMQLAERGLPVWDILAEKMGKSTEELMKMSSNGELMAKDIVPILVDGMGERFAGSMEKQSKTWNGMWSTIKDNAKIASGVISEGLFERVKGYLPQIIDLMERFTDSFQEGGFKGVLDEFLLPGVVNFIFSSIDKVQGIFNDLKETIVTNKDTFKAYLSVVVGYWKNIISAIMGGYETIKSAFQGVGGLGESFGRIFETAKSIVMPIVHDIVTFVKNQLTELKKFWDENGEQIIQAVKNVWSVIASIFEAIAPVLLFIINTLWNTIKGVISGALDIIMGLIKTFAGLFTGDFSAMWEGIKQLFVGAVEFIWNIVNLMMIGRLLGGIKLFGTKAIGFFKNFWKAGVATFKQFVNDVITWFQYFRQTGSSIWQALVDTVKNIIQIFKNSVKMNFNNVLTTVKSIFGRVKDAIINPIKTAKDTVKGFIDDIKGFFSNITTKIKMPHFNVSNFSLNPKDWITKGMPKLSVDWYDKGGVFYGPQVIGVGEKRPEFVGALDDLRKIVREESGGNKTDSTQNSRPVEIIFNGPIIADRQGLKKLERMLRSVRIEENVRLGVESP